MEGDMKAGVVELLVGIMGGVGRWGLCELSWYAGVRGVDCGGVGVGVGVGVGGWIFRCGGFVEVANSCCGRVEGGRGGEGVRGLVLCMVGGWGVGRGVGAVAWVGEKGRVKNKAGKLGEASSRGDEWWEIARRLEVGGMGEVARSWVVAGSWVCRAGVRGLEFWLGCCRAEGWWDAWGCVVAGVGGGTVGWGVGGVVGGKEGGASCVFESVEVIAGGWTDNGWCRVADGCRVGVLVCHCGRCKQWPMMRMGQFQRGRGWVWKKGSSELEVAVLVILEVVGGQSNDGVVCDDRGTECIWPGIGGGIVDRVGSEEDGGEGRFNSMVRVGAVGGLVAIGVGLFVLGGLLFWRVMVVGGEWVVELGWGGYSVEWAGCCIGWLGLGGAFCQLSSGEFWVEVVVSGVLGGVGGAVLCWHWGCVVGEGEGWVGARGRGGADLLRGLWTLRRSDDRGGGR
ncbi:hypothetical protein Tco_0009022 [Tanacetum coccineum]